MYGADAPQTEDASSIPTWTNCSPAQNEDKPHCHHKNDRMTDDVSVLSSSEGKVTQLAMVTVLKAIPLTLCMSTNF